jgi:hypothetical protein
LLILLAAARGNANLLCHNALISAENVICIISER